MRGIHLLLVGIMFVWMACVSKQEPENIAATPAVTGATGEYTYITSPVFDNRIIADSINELIREGNALIKINPDSAMDVYTRSLHLSKQINYQEGIAMSYNNITCCYREKKEYQQMNSYLSLFRKALKKIPGPYYSPENPGHKKLLIDKYNYWASDLYKAGNYDSATTVYMSVIKRLGHADSVTYFPLIATYTGLGAVASHISHWERAFFYFNQAEKLALQYRDTSFWVSVLTNKASLYQDRKDYDRALIIAREALDIAQRKGIYCGDIAQAIAASLLFQNKPEQALIYGQLALKNATETHNKEREISAHYVLGYNYVQLRQYKKAEQHLVAGLSIAREIGHTDNITNAFGQISTAYARLGDYRKAYLYRTSYSFLRDSWLGNENAARIAEINTRYQVAQKDKELAQKDKELALKQLKIAQQQKQQYLWIGGILLLLLLLLGLLHNRRHKVAIARLKALLEGEEKERTRLARELHDGIVSKLSIIKMNFSALPGQYRDLNGTTDFQEVVNQLEQSITELRTTSHNLLPETLQRLGLAESLRIYCKRVSKITPLDIEFQMVGDLPVLRDDFQLNIYRIIQELVHNIIKHANASHALIQFHVQENGLSITIDDNGRGVPEDIGGLQQSNGIGMQNLRDRIRLLHGSMEAEHGAGTSVYLEFNLKRFLQKP